MRHAPTLILILLAQLVYCQTPNIDPQRETVTLTKEQTITLAKIVQNEKRLSGFLDGLRDELAALHDSIQGYALRAAANTQRLQELTILNDTLNAQLLDLERQRQDKPKARHKALYTYTFTTSGPNGFKNVFVGFSYITEPYFFMLGIDPFTAPEMKYSAGVGIRLFNLNKKK